MLLAVSCYKYQISSIKYFESELETPCPSCYSIKYPRPTGVVRAGRIQYPATKKAPNFLNAYFVDFRYI